MATIQMSADKVVSRCIFVLDMIEVQRKKHDEEMIATEMAKTYFSWGMFRRLNYTREEAIKNCRSLSYGWFFPSCYAGKQKEHLEKLLTLALRGDPVTLNETDCHWLYDYD